jgi:GrpB-like predicted nucleotidyltransferase (UPF0157 family)
MPTIRNLIEPHNPSWATKFKEIKNHLLEILLGLDVDIQHVGSTAIPNLPAKPILDIDIIIHDKSLLTDISKRLEDFGYINNGEQGIKGRFAFKQDSENSHKINEIKKWHEHHLYVCFSDCLALKNHLLFRDALLGNSKLVEQYATLKINLTNETGMTREKYTKRKTDFIISVLTKLGLDKYELNDIKNANE